MYLESFDRLERVTLRAQANVAEGLARATERVTAKLSGTIATTVLRDQNSEAAAPREGERRRTGRFATGSAIHARRIPGTNFEVPLDNVSAGGCRIEMIEECALGEDVITRFPDLEPLGARVRWTLGFTAGLQFVRPIHPAVFGSLLERLMAPQQPDA